MIETKPFKHLETADAQERYGETGGQFLAYCIMVAQNIFPQLPACPLPDLATELLLKLYGQLQHDASTVSNSLITACLSSLFIHMIPCDMTDTSFHALQFVILRMIKEDGSYHAHHIMTGILAHLQYCARLAFLNLYIGVGRSDELCLLVGNRVLGGERENIWTYLWDCGENTPLWALRQWMRLMTTVCQKEGLPDTTFWKDTKCTTIQVGNHVISMEQIRTTLKKTLDHVETLMASVTQGAKLPVFNRSAYSDNPSVTDVGFNYLVSSRLYHQGQFGKNFLLQQWMQNGDPWGFAQEELYGDGNHVKWNGSALQRWLNLSDELTKALYFCFHCACGQPARGVEEMTIKIINTAESPRNVFWRGEHFMVQTMYHKTQSIVGHGKNRVTFLPGRMSQHVHNYLAFIRPMQVSV